MKLNDYENHRTESEYADALIAKNFAFQVRLPLQSHARCTQ